MLDILCFMDVYTVLKGNINSLVINKFDKYRRDVNSLVLIKQ